MKSIRVYLFGKMRVLCGGRPCDDCGSTKARELFAYLLLHPNRAHSRERLGSLLWNHVSTERSKAYLRKALWQLQHALDAAHAEAEDDRTASASGNGEPLLVVNGAWIQLNARASVWLDVDVFETAFQAVRDRDAGELTSEEADMLQHAVSLYTSDLLESWYADWCLLERERLQDLYLMALGKLAHYAELDGSYDTGIEYGLRMLQVDIARECAHRRLMRLRYLSGDRTGALRQYLRCAEVLNAELGVEPSTATRQLYTQIRDDVMSPSSALREALPASPLAPDDRPSDASDPSLIGMARIRALRETLAKLQSEVRREIEAVEIAIEERR